MTTHEIHRMTVDEYVRVVHGFGWESTELVEGVVYDTGLTFNRERRTTMDVFHRLDAHYGRTAASAGGTVRLSDISLFDPDLFVLDPAIELDDDDFVPVDAVRLAVEVSVTTQAHDRGPKLIAYAKAGVPEVWLVDPRPAVGELLRHRDPDGASYRTVDRFEVGEGAEDLDVAAILHP